MSDFIATAHTAAWVYALMATVAVIVAGVWRDHTPESQTLAEDFDAACDEVGKRGAIAVAIFDAKIETAAPRLSRCLKGDPLNLWRLAQTPDVLVAFCARVLQRHGFVVFTPKQAELLRGAERVGTLKMARMEMKESA